MLYIFFYQSSGEVSRIRNFPLVYKNVGALEIIPKKIKDSITLQELNLTKIKNRLQRLIEDKKGTIKIIKKMYNISKKINKSKSIRDFKMKFFKLIEI